MKKLVEIKEAFKSFNLRSGGKKLIALDNVSLSLKKGETLGIVGESGSGKSTLGRALLKLLQIDSGSIFIKGQEVSDLPNIEFRPHREKIQMVFKIHGFFRLCLQLKMYFWICSFIDYQITKRGVEH